MPSLTDELMGMTPEAAKKTAEAASKAVGKVKSGAKEAVELTVKGVCLLIKGSGFTADAVMKAVKKVAYKKTGDIKFAKNNINIGKLKKSGHVYPMEENLQKDAMKYFERQCKKFGVKYTAMKDTRGEDKPDYEPSYMVFFEGKDTNLIMKAMTESYKDYAEEQQRTKDAGEKEREKGGQPEKRESVKAKLAFFRDRAADRDQERGAVEKHHQHTDIQR